MNTDAPFGLLASDVVVYRGAGPVRHAWALVLLAGLLSFTIFALLPFLDVVRPPPATTVNVYPVESASAIRPPDPIRIPLPQPPPAAPSPPTVEMPRPKMAPEPDSSEPLAPPVPAISVSLNLAPTAELGDISLDFVLRPTPLPAVAPAAAPPQQQPTATEPASDVYELSDLDRRPRPVLQTAPIYPSRARARDIEGCVQLQFTVMPNGHTAAVLVLAGSPAGVFEKAAIAAVRRWRFEPGMKGDHAVPVRMRINLRFRLD